MKVIPIIYFDKRKIYTEERGEMVSLEDLLKKIEKDTEVYVYDKDGVIRDKPNLCSYPKLSEHCKIWVDHGPRTLGDVVDAVMAGATSVTIRKNLWPKVSVPKIKELTESTIYENFNPKNNKNEMSSSSLSSDVEGFVVFPDTDKFKKDFIYDDLIKSICSRYNTYVVESDEGLFSYWKKIGAAALIIDYCIWTEVKDNEF